MPMGAPAISPLSSGIRDRRAVALCCSTSSGSTRGLGSLRNLQPWYRQGLALLHRNDSDQSRPTRYGIDSARNVEDQATMEMGYLKPEKRQLCMVTEPDVIRESNTVTEVVSAYKPFA